MTETTEDYEMVQGDQQGEDTGTVPAEHDVSDTVMESEDTVEQQPEEGGGDTTVDQAAVPDDPMDQDRPESPDLIAPAPPVKQPARGAPAAKRPVAQPPTRQQPIAPVLGKRKDAEQASASPVKKQRTASGAAPVKPDSAGDTKRAAPPAKTSSAPAKAVSRVPAGAQQAMRALLNQTARPAAKPISTPASGAGQMNGHQPAPLAAAPPASSASPVAPPVAFPSPSVPADGPSFPVLEDGDERKWVFVPQAPLTMKTPRQGYQHDQIYIGNIDLKLLSLIIEQNANTWYGRHGVGQCRWVYGPRRVQDFHARFRLPPAEISFDGGSGWDGTSRLPKFLDHFKAPNQLLEAAIFIAISTSGGWEKQFCNQWGVNETMAHAVVRMFDLHKLHIEALASTPAMLKSFKEGMTPPQDMPAAKFYARKLDDPTKTKLPYSDKLKEDAFDLGELAYNKFAGRTTGADHDSVRSGAASSASAGDAKSSSGHDLWMDMLDPADKAFFKGVQAASAAATAPAAAAAGGRQENKQLAAGAAGGAASGNADKQASLLDPKQDDLNASEFANSMVELARKHWLESKREVMPFNKEKYFRDTAYHNFRMCLERQREVRKAWRQPTYISMSADMFTPISQNSEEEKKHQARGETRDERLQRYMRRIPPDSLIREFTYLQQALADGYRYTEFPIFFGNDPMPVSHWFRLLPLFRRGVVAEVIVSPRQVPQTPKGMFYLTWQLDSIRIVGGLKMELLLQPSSGVIFDNPMLECADPRLIMPPEWHRLTAPSSSAAASATKLIKGPADPESKDGKDGKDAKDKQVVKVESGAVIDITPPAGSEAAVAVGNMTADQLLAAFRSLKKQMLYFDGITYDPAAPAIIRADKKDEKKF